MILTKKSFVVSSACKPRASGDDPNNEYKTFNNML